MRNDRYLFLKIFDTVESFMDLLILYIPGEFDDLISALRTGDVFGEDMAKMAKRNRRRVGNATGDMAGSRERQGGLAAS